MDDCVDAAIRASHYSRSARHWRWADYCFGMLFAGFGAGGLVYFLISLDPVRHRYLWAFAIATGVVGAVTYPWAYWWLFKNRTREYSRGIVGTKPFTVTVELLPDCLSVIQKTGQAQITWDQVASIHDTSGAVDIVLYRGNSVVVVRDRAFSSADQKARFIKEAKSYITEAQKAAVSTS